jgi:hypothetical protein
VVQPHVCAAEKNAETAHFYWLGISILRMANKEEMPGFSTADFSQTPEEGPEP